MMLLPWEDARSRGLFPRLLVKGSFKRGAGLNMDSDRLAVVAVGGNSLISETEEVNVACP